MVGRSRKSDVKSRLGQRNVTTAKPKTGRIRDARDVLKQKGSVKVEIHVNISCSALVKKRCFIRYNIVYINI
jgi:hypothetical protein